MVCSNISKKINVVGTDSFSVFINGIPMNIDCKFLIRQIQLKSLAEEMQAIIKGLEKVKQELAASENDGPVSEVFRKVFSIFMSVS